MFILILSLLLFGFEGSLSCILSVRITRTVPAPVAPGHDEPTDPVIPIPHGTKPRGPSDNAFLRPVTLKLWPLSRTTMLLARSRAIQRFLTPSARLGRCLSTSQSSARTRWSGRSKGSLLRAGALTGILGCSALYYATKPIYADAEDEATESSSSETRRPSLSGLVRSYLVFTACSFPTLVDWSPAIISTCLSLPVLKDVTEAVLRRTFFSQVSRSVIQRSASC